MCRIFGIAYGDRPEKLSTGQIARIMGVSLTNGGPHAFGYMQNVKGDVTVHKYPGRLDEQLEKLYPIKRECEWFVGHTRYQTHGDSSNRYNIHPILHDHILGVHNGVLAGFEKVLEECGGRSSNLTEVGSEAIFAAVEHFGHVKGLAKIFGSMVTVYTDLRKPDSLYIARTNSRALRLGFTTRGNLIFASEQWALDQLEEAGIDFEGFSGINENRVLRIKDGNIKDRSTFRPAQEFPYRAKMIAQAAADEVATDYVNDSIQRTATKRGEFLFPRSEDLSRISRELDGIVNRSRRRIPKERLAAAAWHRDHYSGYAPDPPRKPKKRSRKVTEVGVPVGPNEIKYKGKVMHTDDYITLRATELSDAIITPDSEWED